jgi:NADPH:quinone reductase-like Zn-dependent oxidoreductase
LLRDVQAGQTILIHAAAGGVGSLPGQLAKHKGARVIGTASSAQKLEKAIELGAEVGINYTESDWAEQVLRATNGKGGDFIIEMVGGENRARDRHRPRRPPACLRQQRAVRHRLFAQTVVRRIPA